jgi:hypothetical protein
MSQISDGGIRDALSSSHRFAAYFASTAFGGALGAVLFGRAPLYVLLLAPALGYALYFLLPLVLQLTGAATSDLYVNHWFAWAVCGGLVFFWVGALARAQNVLAEDPLRVGLYTGLVWVALVIVAWLITRLVRRGA